MLTALMGVQKAALKACNFQPGFAYYLEMGLGKTLLTLWEFQKLVDKREATRMVVICPNSFKVGWADEITKHHFQFDSYIYISGNHYWNDAWVRSDFSRPPVLIVNYEAIRSQNTKEFISRFIRNRDSMLVLDESIQIKTHDSIQSKACMMMAPWFKYKRLLSGKPVTTGPHDLWAQMQVIGATHQNYRPWKTTFCLMGGFKGKKVVGTQNEEVLESRIGKYMFRASKKDWTDLPPKVYTARQYDLSVEQERMYRSMEDEFVLWLNENENVTVDTFITKYIKLAQIQSGFIIKEDGAVIELIEPSRNPRFKLLEEILEEVPGKAVIAYYHRYTLDLLQRALSEYNPAFIKGQMKDEEIRHQKERFNTDTHCRVMLAQIRASKYGHTLIGGDDMIDNCSTMIFAENSYSLDDRSQIEDRIHRHGQKAESCLYIDLWGTDLDHRMTTALQNKENIVSATFSFFKVIHSARTRAGSHSATST